MSVPTLLLNGPAACTAAIKLELAGEALIDASVGRDEVEFKAIPATGAMKMALVGVAAGGSIVDAVKEG